MASDLHDIFDRCRDLGWRVDHRNGGHFVLWPKDETLPPVTASATPSSARAIRNLIADLRRSGFYWPHEERRHRRRVAIVRAMGGDRFGPSGLDGVRAGTSVDVTQHDMSPKKEMTMQIEQVKERIHEDRTFGACLRAARKAAGFSVLDAASALGVSHGALRNWEHGYGGMTSGNYAKLLDAFPVLRDAPVPRVTGAGREKCAAKVARPIVTARQESPAAERHEEAPMNAKRVLPGTLSAVARARSNGASADDFRLLIASAAAEGLSARDVADVLGLSVA